MNRLRRMWIPVLLQTAVALAACGDDDGDDTAKPSDGGLDGSTDGGKDGGTSDSGPADAGSFKCGTTTCAALSTIPGAPAATPCCYDPAGANQCSGKVAGGACNKPAVNDPSCTTITIAALNMNIPGCCAETGWCGINSNSTGLGCPDLMTAKTNVPALAPFIPDAAVKMCGVHTDGGLSFISPGGGGMDAGL